MLNMLDCLKLNRIHQEFSISFKIAATKDFVPKTKIGDKGILIWDTNGSKATKISTPAIPIQTCNDFKALVLNYHNDGANILLEFSIGSYYLTVKTPYICRLRIIELDSRKYMEKIKKEDKKKEKKFVVKEIYKEYHENSKVIQGIVYTSEINTINAEFAKEISSILIDSFHDDQLACLEKFLIQDLIQIIHKILN